MTGQVRSGEDQSLLSLLGVSQGLRLLQSLREVVTPGLGQQEGEEPDDDGSAAHDDEGKEGGDGVEVGDGGGQQGAHPGHGGAHPHGRVSDGSVEQLSCNQCMTISKISPVEKH